MGKRIKGVSLIEVIIASTVFAIASAAASSVLVSSGLLISDTEMSTRAEQLCFSVLEEQTDRPFGELVPGSTEVLPVQTVSGQELETEVEVNAVPGADSGQLVSVELRFSWTARNRMHVRRASGLVTNMNH